ncbi:MAG: nitrogenase component 1, partial [Chloroflexota bacterium]
PYESTLADINELARAQVNICMYQEFGQTLADTLGQPTLQAPFGMQQTTEFIQDLGDLFGTHAQAQNFIRQEKKTTLQAVWDLWRGPQSDWFPTVTVGLVGTKTYVDGLKRYLGDELGMQIVFAGHRPNGTTNEEVRQFLHQKAPTFIYGSVNEKIYLAEAGAHRTTFFMAAFPGAAVRRSVGTPFMGYRGTVVLIQDIVNALYDTLFNFLPVDGAYEQQRRGTLGQARQTPGNLPWTSAAKELLDDALENVPFISRISVSRELQMQVENHARAVGASEVTAEVAAGVLVKQGEG